MHNNKGYTLIEVIVALAILAILAVWLLPVIFGAFSQIVHAGNRSKIMNDAQNILEARMNEDTLSTEDNLNFIFTDINGVNPINVQISGEYVDDGTLHIFLPVK